MSYTRTITNGTSVSQEGGPSFDQELEDLQDQIDGIGSGSVPTGTGLRHVTSGVEDGTAYSLSAADMAWSVETTTRSSNAFSGSLATAPASLVTGLTISWRVPSAPSGASTYNLNGLGAKDIYIRNAAAAATDLVANRDLIMRYDGTRWQIIAMGTITAGDIPALPYKGISCGKTSDQSVSADTATDITFTTEIISETSDLSHSTSTNPAEVTINTTQNYRIRATICFAANGTGSYFTEYVSVLVGGTEKHRVPLLGSKVGVTQPHHFSVEIDLPVTAAQIVKLQMYSSVNGGSVLGQVGGVNQTVLSITPLGA